MPGHVFHRRLAFTLIELLIVIAILALLVSILLPSLAAAREAAKVTAVRAELRSVATGLQTYALEHNEAVPPARTYCDARSGRSLELPRELAEGRYLPGRRVGDDGHVDMPDRFAPQTTYRYLHAGWGTHNDAPVPQGIWVPRDWPFDARSADPLTLAGRRYDNVWTPRDEDGKPEPSPVTWAVWSGGPGYNPRRGDPLRAPVARCSWYAGHRTRGVLAVFSKLHDGLLFSD
ncbi:MAG: type II secretion system protein [Phycisphaerae bacterium]